MARRMSRTLSTGCQRLNISLQPATPDYASEIIRTIQTIQIIGITIFSLFLRTKFKCFGYRNFGKFGRTVWNSLSLSARLAGTAILFKRCFGHASFSKGFRVWILFDDAYCRHQLSFHEELTFCLILHYKVVIWDDQIFILATKSSRE